MANKPGKKREHRSRMLLIAGVVCGTIPASVISGLARRPHDPTRNTSPPEGARRGNPKP